MALKGLNSTELKTHDADILPALRDHSSIPVCIFDLCIFLQKYYILGPEQWYNW